MPNAYFHRGGGHIWDHKHPSTIGVFNKIPWLRSIFEGVAAASGGGQAASRESTEAPAGPVFHGGRVGGSAVSSQCCLVCWEIYKPRDPRLFQWHLFVFPLIFAQTNPLKLKMTWDDEEVICIYIYRRIDRVRSQGHAKTTYLQQAIWLLGRWRWAQVRWSSGDSVAAQGVLEAWVADLRGALEGLSAHLIVAYRHEVPMRYPNPDTAMRGWRFYWAVRSTNHWCPLVMFFLQYGSEYQPT